MLGVHVMRYIASCRFRGIVTMCGLVDLVCSKRASVELRRVPVRTCVRAFTCMYAWSFVCTTCLNKDWQKHCACSNACAAHISLILLLECMDARKYTHEHAFDIWRLFAVTLHCAEDYRGVHALQAWFTLVFMYLCMYVYTHERYYVYTHERYLQTQRTCTCVWMN